MSDPRIDNILLMTFAIQMTLLGIVSGGNTGWINIVASVGVVLSLIVVIAEVSRRISEYFGLFPTSS